MDVGDIADLLGVTDSKVYEMLKNKEIPFAYKVGRIWRFEMRDVRKWMKERQGKSK